MPNMWPTNNATAIGFCNLEAQQHQLSTPASHAEFTVSFLPGAAIVETLPIRFVAKVADTSREFIQLTQA